MGKQPCLFKWSDITRSMGLAVPGDACHCVINWPICESLATAQRAPVVVQTAVRELVCRLRINASGVEQLLQAGTVPVEGIVACSKTRA